MDQHCDRNGFERVPGWGKAQILGEQKFHNFFQVFQVSHDMNISTVQHRNMYGCYLTKKHAYSCGKVITLKTGNVKLTSS